MAVVLSPNLVRLPFLSTENLTNVWRDCTKRLEDWREGRLSLELEEQKKHQMAIKLIWETNVLEDTIPSNILLEKVASVLERIYNNEDDIDTGRKDSGIAQMINHLKAFMYLLSHKEEHLTEDLIKETHRIMMEGLSNEGFPVNNGEYRQSSVCAGLHVFPPHKCVPLEIKRIVKEYNERISKPDHDPHVLAAWIHFEVVSLHPFEDGNGRTSRLLWCYSLMKDGLPFPPVLTSGHKKSQKHLVNCLKKDRDLFYSNHSHMTTLTVVSVSQGWKDFLGIQ